jgi:KaiC/GvpD/RAD55 family RecA-like ATPase
MTIDEAKIRQELSDLPENFIILFLADASSYLEMNSFILKYLLQEKKADGIYITVNRTAKSIRENIERMGIEAKNIFFIDCASGAVTKRYQKVESTLIIYPPENLTDIGIMLSEKIKASSAKNQFLLLDSLSTLLLFNSTKTVVKFSHFLVNLIREYKLKGVLMSLEKETDEFVKRTLYVFSDKVINV